MTLVREAIIPLTAEGQRVDSALAALFPEYSRSQLTRWLKLGQLTLNARTYQPKEKVYGQEQVILTLDATPQAAAPRPEAIPLDICFEDEHCLIVNKPQNLIVHPGAGRPDHTLVNALLHYDSTLEQLPRAGIIHRLDKDTTGLLMVAKTLPAYTAWIQHMQQRRIERRYLALVHGRLSQSGQLDTFYGRHPRNRLKMAVCARGKQAISHYSPCENWAHFTLLDIKLETGRTHQIRVHMQYLKHAVVGDQLYGQRYAAQIAPTLKTHLNAFQRQALHAYRLNFSHPMTHEAKQIEAPLPDDFQALLTAIRMEAQNE